MSLGDVARSTLGRAIATVVGLGLVALIVRDLGFDVVGHAIERAAAYFPFVVLLEGAILACSTLALRALYGDAGKNVPVSQLARAALVGYAVQGVMPAGRAAAEATRASLLARWVGTARAAAAAGRMQAVVLIANGIVSTAATIAVLADGRAPRWLPIVIGANSVVTLGLGGAILIVARRAKIGSWLGRRVKRLAGFGADLDVALRAEAPVPAAAIAWELLGRVVQVAQNAVLIACLGTGAVSLGLAFCAEGIHLVGAAVGDLIPAQLGATEGNFRLAGSALGLSHASAVSIAVIAHLAQLVWVSVGALVLLLWRPARRIATKVPAKEPQ
ncbi:MAG TPA: lysylphosphatidylglycerol synthase domain-containing protein [Kofleriaceae bacterium]|jgi:hypothetical protein